MTGQGQTGAGPVLEDLRALVQDQETGRRIPLAYLEKRESQMRYPDFQARGWPIGNGAVESANKLVVESRLKDGGMHWARPNVNPMLGLRNIVCADRWAEEWPRIAGRLRADVRRGGRPTLRGAGTPGAKGEGPDVGESRTSGPADPRRRSWWKTPPGLGSPADGKRQNPLAARRPIIPGAALRLAALDNLPKH